ncbi:hypothetical protein JYP49_16615 [Nitratireductor aquimarinus]|uniref:hypothetical protein n=1 Tax=Nitratireductor TaxID=245876 RepID=UPI0019D3D0E7|nr:MULTISPECIES: hypothetical protein [Nitratireductor]MBN7777897.1 hypothetical protein [Nitratireductor pacificus]MBN7782219.1 hypothetical protein [Nitratireductor pacificus]MBN7791026.1 hypothetical protein [Nitratireductor aquimarinus]MBY6100107.1 hypothetical protein [Nitratireductor aquimarinus]
MFRKAGKRVARVKDLRGERDGPARQRCKHKILLGFFAKPLTGYGPAMPHGVNTSTKPGTNRLRITDIRMFLLCSPQYLVVSTGSGQTAHSLSTNAPAQPERRVNEAVSN